MTVFQRPRQERLIVVHNDKEVTMNKSEQLLSAFAADYFFKELVVDDLHFKPDESSEKEVADLLINLDDIIIAIQLKSRNDKDQTDDFSVEDKWLRKKCKVAKGQVKETLQFISSGTLPAFRNKRGQEVFVRSDAELFLRITKLKIILIF